MPTLKQVLSRTEEQRNLRNVFFCVLIVITAVAGAFTLVHIKHLVESAPRYARSVSIEPDAAALKTEVK